MGITKSVGIKSIQRGSAALINGDFFINVTVNSVNPDKSQLALVGFVSNNGAASLPTNDIPRLYLTSATTVAIMREAITVNTVICTYELTEWY